MSVIFASKFVKLIQSWDKKDLKAFDNWLKSPWCNSNKNLIPLFEQLSRYYPKFKSRNAITKEELFHLILPKGKFSDRRMNNLMSEGYLAAKKFIAFQRFKQEERLQKEVLVQELQSRHLEDWFFKVIGEEIEQLEEIPVKEWEDYLSLFLLHRRLYHHPNQSPRMQAGGMTIVKMGEQIDLIYLLEKAAIINEKIFRNRILRGENHDIKSELRIWLLASEEIDHPALDFYRYRFAYTEDNMTAQFFELRKAFFSRFAEVNEKEQKLHLLSLLNDAVWLKKKLKIELEELLPIYEFGFKHGLFLQQGIITRITFTTAIVISNSLKKFDFTEEVTNNYSKFLAEEIQQDAIYWAKAHTYSKKEKYEACLDTLLSHHFQSTYFLRVTKVLTLQTYFELFINNPDAYHEYLLSYCKAFEKWIRREKQLSKNNKEAYFYFIQKVRSLIRIFIDIEYKPEELEHLFQGVKNIEAFDWLLQKQKQIRQLKQLLK
jgi:hypothetical protein